MSVQQQSGFPYRGETALTLRLARPATFALRVRVPAWANPLILEAEGIHLTSQGGWATVPAREWKDGDRITFKFTLGARLLLGEHGNAGRAAVAWGPFVLACDQQYNGALPSLFTLGLVDSQPSLTRKTDRDLTFGVKVVAGKDAKPATPIRASRSPRVRSCKRWPNNAQNARMDALSLLPKEFSPKVTVADETDPRNFLDCVWSRKHLNADVGIGLRSVTVTHLGNIDRWVEGRQE